MHHIADGELTALALEGLHHEVAVFGDVDRPALDVVGAVTLAMPGNPYSEISRPDELEVRMLAVAEAARGQGIAHLLMDAVEARARDLGLTGVALSTAPTMHAAHRLYERRGYERDEARDWMPEPDFTLMAYRLALS